MKTWKNSSQKLLIIHNQFFFSTSLAAQKAHFGQKLEFNRLSVTPLYNLLGWQPNVYFWKPNIITTIFQHPWVMRPLDLYYKNLKEFSEIGNKIIAKSSTVWPVTLINA